MKKLLVVGAGLSGTVAAELAAENGWQVTVVDERNHLGGNCASQEKDGIAVHLYGPHIFHTNDENLWKWFTERCPLAPYSHQVKALAPDDKMYSLPFSMQTAYEMFGATSYKEFEAIREHELEILKDDHYQIDLNTVEGYALSKIGSMMYRKLVQGYTAKQWGCSPSKLPASVVGRLPVRNTFDVSYYADRYVGIPKDSKGYMPFFERLRKIANVILGVDDKKVNSLVLGSDAVIYTGPIDRFYDYALGHIQYRTCSWKYEKKAAADTTGMPVLNYTDGTVKATRRIEYRYLQQNCDSEFTHIAYETPEQYTNQEAGPMYVVPTEENKKVIKKYEEWAKAPDYYGVPVLFLGRLAESRYLDMNTTIENAFKKVPEFLKKVSEML